MGLYLSLVVIHFVGDFLCQSDWMALNKSKRWDALALHVLVYSVVLILGLHWLMGYEGTGWNGGKFIAVNAVLHFLTDAATSRVNSRFWFFRREDGIWQQATYAVPKHGRELVNPWTPIDGKRHWFFVGIGFDQVLHYAALFITAEQWLS